MKQFSQTLAIGALLMGTVFGPTAAFADDGADLSEVASGYLGTVQTGAVMAPITAGDITYIPGEAMGGAIGTFLGTVETVAVSAPITSGDITYIPGGAMGGTAGTFIGTVQTAAVTAPITEGDITYIP